LAAYENCGLGSGFEGSRMDKEIPFRPFVESYSRRAIIWGSWSNVRGTTRERSGTASFPRVRK